MVLNFIYSFTFITIAVIFKRILERKNLVIKRLEREFFENCYLLNNSLKEGISLETAFKKISSEFKDFNDYLNFSFQNSTSKIVKEACTLLQACISNNLEISNALNEVLYYRNLYNEDLKNYFKAKSMEDWSFIFSLFVFPVSFYSLLQIIKINIFAIFFTSIISSIGLLIFSFIISRNIKRSMIFFPIIFLINYLFFFYS